MTAIVPRGDHGAKTTWAAEGAPACRRGYLIFKGLSEVGEHPVAAPARQPPVRYIQTGPQQLLAPTSGFRAFAAIAALDDLR